ncbi:MAG: hypothetical protein JWO51_120 [Rhodospirillales bacterium]|nr:hypothetical protein [Rhodospirillales bacterium]
MARNLRLLVGRGLEGILAAVVALVLVFVATFGAFSGIRQFAGALEECQAEQQNQRADGAEKKAQPMLPGAAIGLGAEAHTKAGERQRSGEQNKLLNTLFDWAGRFLDVKATDVIVAFFTGILAWKTHGLFVETAALRAIVIEGGGTYSFSALRLIFTPIQEIPLLARWDIQLYAYGFLLYEDFLGNERIMTFCRKIYFMENGSDALFLDFPAPIYKIRG